MAKFNELYDVDSVQAIQSAIDSKVEMNERGCMIWTGRFAHRSPIIQVRLKGGKALYNSVKRFMVMKTEPDRDFPEKYRYCNTCGDYRCINPEHVFPCDVDTAKAVEVIAWLKHNSLRYNSNIEMAKAYGCSHITIGKYRKMYQQNPDVWDKLVEGFNYAKKND